MPLVLPVWTQIRTRRRFPGDRSPVQATTRPEGTQMWRVPQLETTSAHRLPGRANHMESQAKGKTERDSRVSADRRTEYRMDMGLAIPERERKNCVMVTHDLEGMGSVGGRALGNKQRVLRKQVLST